MTTRFRILLDNIVIFMTTPCAHFAELIAALNRAPQQGYQALVELVTQLYPAEAVALLQLEGETLRPLAVQGLAADTLGRRFQVAEHPRLQAILSHPGALRFPEDSPLPDPYDGLVLGLSGTLHVHDCMGLALSCQGRTWGMLTLDSLNAGQLAVLADHELRELEQLASSVITCIEQQRQLRERAERQRVVSEALLEELPGAEEMIGSSLAMQQLRGELKSVAGTDLAVLILGETGVGKELVARSVHRHSARTGAPLVYVNCAALPETIAESELFGHSRGAFSGAVSDRRGKFELADGGTLFLDEVGELPLSIQAKLLRALQNGDIQRVGSDQHLKVDVRIAAATNRDLTAEVKAGRFRADLYHRLSVYPVRVPPLRERGQDIVELAGYFLELNRARLGLRNLRLDRAAEQALKNYHWPGNVRELEHLLGRAALKARAQAPGRDLVTIGHTQLDLNQLPQPVAEPVPEEHAWAAKYDLRSALDNYQRQLIEQAVQAAAGNWAEAARHLGLERANLHRLAKRLGLK